LPCSADNALYSRTYVTTCGGNTREGPLNPEDIENEKMTINRFPGKAEIKRQTIFEKLRAV
jgi:hypothetical protein